ncbi:hypothetical protein OsJ_31714 [Oryza sativa Japonica Group]|uniref:Uncharacterized protein n=1 Tax=Oryza sativa subsp. japonica TaxID=39947 RepID=B9G605_ORYSJ|nr:hypothetical protein OsJ_31714 [Oryza sativa Japonica Group]
MASQFSSPAPARFPADERDVGVVRGGEATEEERQRAGVCGEAAEERNGRSPGEAGRRMVSLMSRLQNPDSAKTWLTTESSRAATRELETGGSSAHAATGALPPIQPPLQLAHARG